MRFADLHGVQHDHAWAREHLAHLRTATSGATAPPDGHAFWGMLRSAAHDLVRHLTDHMREEEAGLFAALEAQDVPAELAALRADHAALDLLLAALTACVDGLGPGCAPGAWREAQAVVRRVEQRLMAHVVAEEGLLRRLARLGAGG